MTKRIISVCIAVMLVALGSLCAFAAEPQVTADTICYISFQAGNNDYDGLTPDTPKKQLLTTEDNAAMGVLKDGGTLVAVGKLYIGGDYTLPELPSTLKITSNDGKKDYKNGIPFENPTCAMKMKAAATLTLQSDVIIDDIILFQESTMNTIKVTNNSTLVIGSKTECMSNINALNPCYMAIEVEKGSTVILNGGTFQQVTGEGKIINNGAVIGGSESAESTTKAPDTTTKAPEVTTKAPETTTKAPATSADEKPVVATSDTTDQNVTTAPEGTTASGETTVIGETTAEASDATVDSAETVDTTTAEASNATVPETTTAPAAVEEGGVNVGLIIGIVAAVIVVAAVVIVIVTKKKK